MNKNIFFSMHISENFARKHQIVAFYSKSIISFYSIKNFKAIVQIVLFFDQIVFETQNTRIYSFDHFMTNIVQIDINSSQITKNNTMWNKLKKFFAKTRNEKLTKKIVEKIIDLTKKSKKKKLKLRKIKKTNFQKSIIENSKKVSTNVMTKARINWYNELKN